MDGKEPMVEFGRHKISRRNLLKMVGIYGASAALGVGVGKAISTGMEKIDNAEAAKTKAENKVAEISATATRVAVDLARARVSATKEASTANSTENLMKEIPRFAKTRSVGMSYHLLDLSSEKDLGNGTNSYSLENYGASGTLLGKIDDKLIIFTAGHANELDPTKNKLYSITVDLKGLSTEFPSGSLDISSSKDVDLGIVIVKNSSFDIDSELVKIGEIPKQGDTLYAISFPDTLDHRSDAFPQKFVVTRADDTEIVGDGVISGGGSGGGVYNSNNELVGVIFAVGSEGVYMSPVKPYYDKLITKVGIKNPS